MTRQNLCQNPACGSNVTGWTGGAGAPARVTGLSGFPVTTGAQYTSGTYQQTPSGAASPGVTYTGSLYIRSNGLDQNGKTLYLVFVRSSGGDDFSHTTPISITSGVVTRISLTAVAPANTTGVYLLADGINAAVVPIDLTAVLLEASGSADTYFDGDSPGASWDGTPDNSSSTLVDASAAPDGLGVPVTPGSPTAALGLTGAPDGLAVAVTLGAPAVALTAAAPAGLAVSRSLGTPRAGVVGSTTTRPFTGITVRPYTGVTVRP